MRLLMSQYAFRMCPDPSLRVHCIGQQSRYGRAGEKNKFLPLSEMQTLVAPSVAGHFTGAQM